MVELSPQDLAQILENQEAILERLEETLQILRELRGILERLRSNPITRRWL
jgi:sensor histidine kinase regulating citrate/malate metabolism